MSVHQSHTDAQPNRLIEEKSPYLLQHAYNPVDWYAWGDEPFQLALEQDKPVFLSIGYSTCHWCHVMEKESFEKETIADILNKHFISIKVDREERPDIDQIYMIATQAMTGAGGWPMSVFLFPDRKPFYAGTYFPPEPRQNHPGFGELLKAIVRAWQEKRSELAGSAEKITGYLRDSGSIQGTSSEDLDAKWSDNGFAACQKSYDKQFAGFGIKNKFPRPSTLSFLHAYHSRTDNESALEMAHDTLEAMAMGGMYDHIGGGFHRYSVDRQWRIPHFEKMLYDQAQLVVSYLEIYQKTGREFFATIARETVEYVLRDLRHPDGGLYSAEDADSINPYNHDEHGEGAFYLWEENEIDNLLDEQDSSVFKTCYNVRPGGNALEDPAEEFTGRNILFRLKHDHELALELGMDIDSFQNALARSKKKLLQRRQQRPHPHLDDKIITAWNGLMITALAKSASVLGVPSFLVEAERVADFILDRLITEDGRILRRWRDGEARFQAVLEDYAFFIQGLLDLHEVTQHYHYLEQAVKLMKQQQELFTDPAGGYFSSMESDELLTRMKDIYDGAEPSGNSIAAMNALRLGRLLNTPEWIARGEKTIGSFASVLESHGQAMPMLLTALESALAPPIQLVIAGDAGAEDTNALLDRANRFYLPFKHIFLADGGKNHVRLSESLGFLKTVERMNNGATAYLCRNFTCQMPTNDPEKLAELLQEVQQGNEK